MGKASREKGKRGERELASYLRDQGYDARRGVQFCGINGNADVVGLSGVHIECKRVETLRIYDAVEQARRDAQGADIPAVFHRRNNHEWLVIMTADDFIKLYREYKE